MVPAVLVPELVARSTHDKGRLGLDLLAAQGVGRRGQVGVSVALDKTGGCQVPSSGGLLGQLALHSEANTGEVRLLCINRMIPLIHELFKSGRQQ
jgi:hypothetical protein